MTEETQAPWTDEQVRSLNRFQQAGIMHPFTCARRGEPGHVSRPDADKGQLVATASGWVCPDCDYTQTWAHAGMADGAFIDAQIRALNNLFRDDD